MFPTEPVPEKLGAYKVIRRLAGVGAADLYLGRMEGPMGFQRVCALKLVPNSIDGDIRFAEELAREAAICAKLNHPSIVRMFDFFEHDKRLVLVLEHVEGADLERLLQHLLRRKQRLSDNAIWFLAHQLTSALAHAHAATDEGGAVTPVIHRNIAPENVLISWDGEVRLAGFGLGKILGRTPDTVLGGTVKGTPGFMAPEQQRGERVTSRADVYGLGALIWSLLAGRRPPINGRPEGMSAVRNDIPREISAAIDAMLEPSPEKRKITCADLEQWLEKVTDVESGRKELRDKILLLRATRGEPGSNEGARPARAATQPRRRVSLRQVKASQRPAGSGPLSVPPPSSRSASSIPPRSRRVDDRVEPDSNPPPSMSLRSPAMSARPPAASARPPPVQSARPPAGSARPGPMTDSPPPSRARPAQRTLMGGLTADSEPPATQRPLPSPPPPEAAMQMIVAPPPVPPMFDEHSHDAIPSIIHSSAGRVALEPNWRDVSDDAAPLARVESSTIRSRAPIVSISLEGKRARPLSPLQSLAVMVATAGLVVGFGIWMVERRMDPAPAAASSSAASAGLMQARSGDTTRPVAPTTDTAATSPTPIAVAPRSPDPAVPPAGYAYLTVTSPDPATVFINGNVAGDSNQAIKVVCGRFFVRLGQLVDGGRYPAWLAPGVTVLIPCQGTMTMQMRPQ